MEEHYRKRKIGEKENPNSIYPVSIMNAPFKGPKDAPVTIIEYTDYQCSFCKQIQPIIDALFKKYPGKICFATMNNPLPSHKNALFAAMASRAAARQGKFWEMHELIFENSESLNNTKLIKLAEKIGLNIEQFNRDIKDKKL